MSGEQLNKDGRWSTVFNRRSFLQASVGASVTSIGGFTHSTLAQETTDGYENSWPSVGYDSGNTRYNPNIGGPENDGGISNVKKFEGEDTFRTGSPVVADNRIYIAPGNEARLYAIDLQDWSIDWTFETDDEIEAQPTVSDGIVYIESGGGTMHAIDANNGSERWQQTEVSHGSNNHSPPVIVDDVLYNVDSSPGEGTYALDVSDGSILWTADYRSSVAGPAVVDDVVYTVSDIDDPIGLAALSASDGEELWFVETDARPTASPVVANGRVFYAENSGEANLYAFSADDGEELWKFGPTDSRITAPAVADGIAVVHAGLDGLYAIDTENGSEQWRVDTTGGWWSSGVSLPAIADGTVYVLLDSDELAAIDSETGDELWTLNIGSGGSSNVSSPAVSNGRIYIQQKHQDISSTDDDNVRIESVLTYPTRLYEINSDGQEPPEVTIEGPDAPAVGEPVTYTATIESDGDWDITWGVEDGEDAIEYSGQEISHEFENDGEFQIGVGVENSDGIGNTATIIVDVEGSAGSSVGGTVFQEFDGATDSPLFPVLIGGGALGASYFGYRKYQADSNKTSTNSDATSDTEDVDTPDPRHEDPLLGTIPNFEELQLGERVEQTAGVEIRRATVGSNVAWVAKPTLGDNETVSTDIIEQFEATITPWTKIESHPCLVTVYKTSTDPLPWAAVEQANYTPLVTVVDNLSMDETFDALKKVCEVLHHVYRYGTAYENLTTESVLYTDNGEVKLRGILDQFDESNPWYNAPEEFDGESTEHSTVYRIGLIAYELLTGTLPYQGYPNGVPREQIQSTEPSLPSEQIDDIPAKLESIIMKALSKSPDDRYETVLHLRDEFDSLDIS